jgi:hypothetical protein
MELLRCFIVTQFQRIIYPPENEGDASVQKRPGKQYTGYYMEHLLYFTRFLSTK